MGNLSVPDQYNHNRFVQSTSSTIEAYTTEFFARTNLIGSESQRPIFIIGMPRSGTTLVEQILSSHPLVYGGGELETINHIVFNELLKDVKRDDQLPSYSKQLERLDQHGAERLCDLYLAHISELAGDEPRVTDKMPGNFFHLGLIALLFPQARIIHCRRQPFDLCLSCYFQNFVGPHYYAWNLENLGRYYQQYMRLMDHWRATLPIALLEVDYEEIVDDQEGVSRRLIDHCGLPWDEGCLDFHQNQRRVETASKWQVRQPIYRRSVDRWKNYEQFLGPLKQGLDWTQP
jgi:hypothetical protein